MKNLILLLIITMTAGLLHSQQLMEVDGGLKIGNTAIDSEGSIKYDGTDIYGRVAGSWKSLTVDTVDHIIDTDGDTRIFLNEAGSDHIQYELDGTWAFKMKRTAFGDSYIDWNNTAFHRNLFIGREAGWLTTALWNTAVGQGALKMNTSGEENTAYGAEALYSNDLGNRNVAIGKQALYGNITGSDVIAIGKDAAYNNGSRNRNIAIGSGALFTNTRTSSNIAIGYNALRSYNRTTNDLPNIAIGAESQYNGVEAVYNVSVGNRTLFSNNSGNFNCAFGYISLAASNATSNTAFGHSSLSRIQTGGNNVGIGDFLTVDGGSSSFNVYIGSQVANNSPSGGGTKLRSRNTIIGYKAGYTTDGSDNVFIGHEAGYNEVNGNRLYISNDNGDADNALIYGEFDNKYLRINGQVNIKSIVTLSPSNVQPGAPNIGDLYMDDGTNTGGTPTLRYWNGTIWVNL